jgi:hypothetical protein
MLANVYKISAEGEQRQERERKNPIDDGFGVAHQSEEITVHRSSQTWAKGYCRVQFDICRTAIGSRTQRRVSKHENKYDSFDTYHLLFKCIVTFAE